ncbi:MAG: protoheme IX farnesyltransferase [Acetobacteraceae bacterium]|nr:protoheme IX farnesyltransferase [Acetobacteraceae bacterium]
MDENVGQVSLQGTVEAAAASEQRPARGYASSASDWFELLKPRVVQLVVFTGWIGLLIAPGSLHPVMALTAVLCIAAAAGAAGAINMWYDRDIDLLMERTRNRPIPAGRIAAKTALGFGVLLATASVLVMALTTNLVAAALLAASVGFYVFIYTIWLKRRTAQNIVIGGAAGAFPPVIGWAAVTGGVDVLPVLMFTIVFLWTPPHFWVLSLWNHSDYQRAGVPMLPVVAGARATRRHVAVYTLLLVILTALPGLLRLTGMFYGLSATVLGLGFIWHAWRVLRDPQDAAGASQTSDAPAKAAFKYSILYLFMLFAALAVDQMIG